MNDKQKKFLQLAVIEKRTYNEIEHKLGLERRIFSLWWEELKEERLKLANIRDKWQVKCPEIPFDEFKNLYENSPKECYYCGITENELTLLWKKNPSLTKRKRGKVLEIDRKEPNLPYNVTDNLVFACYWCNNAKTDTFEADEFKPIGELIGQTLKSRLLK